MSYVNPWSLLSSYRAIPPIRELEQNPSTPDFLFGFRRIFDFCYGLHHYTTCVDLGAGNGILSTYASSIGSKVLLVEKDKRFLFGLGSLYDMVGFCGGDLSYFLGDVGQVCGDFVDYVIMNPPFGGYGLDSNTHADREFIQAACALSDNVYGFTPSKCIEFVMSYFAGLGFHPVVVEHLNCALLSIHPDHTGKVSSIAFYCFRRNRPRYFCSQSSFLHVHAKEGSGPWLKKEQAETNHQNPPIFTEDGLVCDVSLQ